MTFRRLPHLADRADLIKWADRVDARSEFPRLVRGLIKANNDQVITLQMRAAEGKWADVRASDVDDIEQALELAPAVHHRFSEIAGKSAHGATSIDCGGRSSAVSRHRPSKRRWFSRDAPMELLVC